MGGIKSRPAYMAESISDVKASSNGEHRSVFRVLGILLLCCGKARIHERYSAIEQRQ